MGEEARGWLLVSRKLFASDLWDTGEPYDRRSALLDLLQAAAHSPYVARIRGHDVHLQPGELVTNVRRLAKRWRWSKSAVGRFLDLLQERETITRRPAWKGSKQDRPPTIATFVKWAEYQRPVGRFRGTARTQATQGQTPNAWDASVGRFSDDLDAWDCELGRSAGTAGSQATPDETPNGWDAPLGLRAGTIIERRDVYKEYPLTNRPDLFPELARLPTGASSFDVVAALADITSRYGRKPNGRGLSIKLLADVIEAGAIPGDVAHAIRGLRALADAGDFSGWIEPGEPFTIAGVLTDKARHLQGQPVFPAAADHSTTTDSVDGDPPTT